MYPLVPYMLLICYERDLMKSLAKEKTGIEIIDTFNSTYRYIGDLLKIDNIHFEQMIHRILQLNKTNASDTEAAFKD